PTSLPSLHDALPIYHHADERVAGEEHEHTEAAVQGDLADLAAHVPLHGEPLGPPGRLDAFGDRPVRALAQRSQDTAGEGTPDRQDRKSTRLNSSHVS